LQAMRGLREKKKMHIILIAHHALRKFSDPEMDQIDRYEIKLNSKASALVQESCDMVLFCKHKNITKKEDTGFGNSRTRGISTGKRVMCTTETPSYVAKNRFNLPDEIDLSWSALAAALNPTPVTTQAKG
jgi:CRISPR/Cas system CSM-associated protein Csm4 (group 5 of RAMP superfamily)